MNADEQRQIDWDQCPIGQRCLSETSNNRKSHEEIKEKLIDLKITISKLGTKVTIWVSIVLVILTGILSIAFESLKDLIRIGHQ